MSELSLAKLTATIQQNLQSSYEYAEDQASLNRLDEDDTVTMALSNAEVEIPVYFKLEKHRVDTDKVLAQSSDNSAQELSELRLQLPTAPSVLKRSLKMLGKMVQAREFIVASSSVAADNAKEQLQQVNNEIKQVIEEQAQAIQHADKSLNDLSVSLLNAGQLSSSSIAAAGKIKFTFKPTL